MSVYLKLKTIDERLGSYRRKRECYNLKSNQSLRVLTLQLTYLSTEYFPAPVQLHQFYWKHMHMNVNYRVARERFENETPHGAQCCRVECVMPDANACNTSTVNNRRVLCQ